MIPWENKPEPKPAPDDVDIKIGPCTLSITDAQDGSDKRWQWFTISMGEFSEAPMDECMQTWPKRAIQLMRQAVSECDRCLKELDQ